MSVAIGFAASVITFLIAIITATWYLSGKISEIRGDLKAGNQRMDDKDTHCENQKESCNRRFEFLEKFSEKIRNGISVKDQ